MLEAISGAEWRHIPAGLMMAAGLAAITMGLRQIVDGWRRPLGDPRKVMVGFSGFRIAVIGLALAGLGASWNWHILWLFVLSAVFGGEELIESTVHMAAE